MSNHLSEDVEDLESERDDLRNQVSELEDRVGELEDPLTRSLDVMPDDSDDRSDWILDVKSALGLLEEETAVVVEKKADLHSLRHRTGSLWVLRVRSASPCLPVL